MNDITITTAGRASADPELKYTQSGKAVCTVRLAIQHRKKVGDTWENAATTWLDCQAWDALAENMAASIKKGDRVIVTGRLSTEEWTGKDGDKRTTQRVAVDDIGLSVRFGTVTAQQSQRSGSSGASKGRQRSQDDDPWATGPGNDAPPF